MHCKAELEGRINADRFSYVSDRVIKENISILNRNSMGIEYRSNDVLTHLM
jgi:hypothetical protein